MATKDISDVQVCAAIIESKADWERNSGRSGRWPPEILQEWTGQPEKVCYNAMERAYRRELIECGVSLRSAWLTEKGQALLAGE